MTNPGSLTGSLTCDDDSLARHGSVSSALGPSEQGPRKEHVASQQHRDHHQQLNHLPASLPPPESRLGLLYPRTGTHVSDWLVSHPLRAGSAGPAGFRHQGSTLSFVSTMWFTPDLNLVTLGSLGPTEREGETHISCLLNHGMSIDKSRGSIELDMRIIDH